MSRIYWVKRVVEMKSMQLLLGYVISNKPTSGDIAHPMLIRHP